MKNKRMSALHRFVKIVIQRSAETFVVNQSLFLRFNSESIRDGENRQCAKTLYTMARLDFL